MNQHNGLWVGNNQKTVHLRKIIHVIFFLIQSWDIITKVPLFFKTNSSQITKKRKSKLGKIKLINSTLSFQLMTQRMEIKQILCSELKDKMSPKNLQEWRVPEFHQEEEPASSLADQYLYFIHYFKIGHFLIFYILKKFEIFRMCFFPIKFEPKITKFSVTFLEEKYFNDFRKHQ